MAKTKNKTKGKNAAIEKTNTQATATGQRLKLSDLRQDDSLWYRILLLIHDFQHQKQEASKSRAYEIIDIIYIGSPYFTAEEAESIKAVVVDDSTQQTLEAKIHATLEHRQATTLTAIFPCGPHDMVPVYLECFNIDKSEIADAKFLARVEKCGLKVE